MSGDGSFLATAAAREWASTKSKKGASPTKSPPSTPRSASDSASSHQRGRKHPSRRSLTAREEQGGQSADASPPTAREWAITKSKKGTSPSKSPPATPRGTDSASSQHRANGSRRSLAAREEQGGQSADASPPAYQQRASPMVSSRLEQQRRGLASRRVPSPPASPWPQDMAGGFIPYSPILDLGENTPRSTPRPTSPASTPRDAYGANTARTPRQRLSALPDIDASVDLSLNASFAAAAIVPPSSVLPSGGRGDDEPRGLEFSLLPQSPIMPSANDISGIPVCRAQLLQQLDDRDAQVAGLKETLAAARHAGALRVAALESEAIALREAAVDARGKEHAAVQEAAKTRAESQREKELAWKGHEERRVLQNQVRDLEGSCRQLLAQVSEANPETFEMLIRRLHECDGERTRLRGALVERDTLLAERDTALAHAQDRLNEKERSMLAMHEELERYVASLERKCKDAMDDVHRLANSAPPAEHSTRPGEDAATGGDARRSTREESMLHLTLGGLETLLPALHLHLQTNTASDALSSRSIRKARARVTALEALLAASLECEKQLRLELEGSAALKVAMYGEFPDASSPEEVAQSLETLRHQNTALQETVATLSERVSSATRRAEAAEQGFASAREAKDALEAEMAGVREAKEALEDEMAGMVESIELERATARQESAALPRNMQELEEGRAQLRALEFACLEKEQEALRSARDFSSVERSGPPSGRPLASTST
ncbi:hypothetical protein T484DRAFT_1784047 [Baffinella frigidus]|nr:hypothetical protein T484DRAFT_1784047 [Cryptophyta sp. CCMP2293]